jgi:hypothetical protein
MHPNPKTSLLLTALLFWGCQGPDDPAASLPGQTPLAAAGHAELTSHEELVAFLEALDRGSPRVTLAELGHSVSGRTIPYLKVALPGHDFGAEREERLVVLLYAQKHGNEPSGKEGALELALALARGELDDLLERVDLLLVPQLNPDGAEAHRRTNDDGVDLNRSHLILDGHEVLGLRELFHRWEPEVAVDVHEYYPWTDAWLEAGWLRLWDLQVGLPTNLNTDPAIMALAEEGALPWILEALEEAGFTGHNYVVGSPERLRWSTTSANDGRQGLALLHTLSLIFEGKRSEPLAADMATRAGAQRVGMEALLRFAATEGPRIREAVHGARNRAREGAIGHFVPVMDRGRSAEPLEIPVLEVRRGDNGDWVVGDTVTAAVQGWYPLVREVERSSLPPAWIVPGTETELLALLEAHRIRMEPLEEGADLPVEILFVAGWETLLLESEQRLPVVRTRPARHRAGPGDVRVPSAQLRGILAATLLEPRSMHGIHTYDRFRALVEDAMGGDWPVLREQALAP